MFIASSLSFTVFSTAPQLQPAAPPLALEFTVWRSALFGKWLKVSRTLD
jgi:hypothetical protein